MSSTALAAPPGSDDPPDRSKSKPLKVTGRLKRALDLMVWGDGERMYLPDNEAAVITGMNVLSIRNALELPHVLAYYKRQREVLRARESPANIHRLREIRDAADNMPAVQAIKLLEQLPDDAQSSTRQAMPGFVVQIVNHSSAPASATTVHIEERRSAMPNDGRDVP